MNIHKVPYNQAKQYRDAAIERGSLSADMSPQEQAARLSELTSDENHKYDFSQLYNANALVKGRSVIHDYTTGVYDKYADPLIKKAFGDNSATRVVSDIARGVIDSAPELAMMVASRGKNRGPLTKAFGNIAASTSAGLNAYGETGDPVTAATSGIITAATPTAVNLASKAAPRILPSSFTSTPLRESLTSGALANVATTIPSVALTPQMSQLSESGPAVATEKVNPLDFSRMGGRLVDFAKDPEQMAIALGGGALSDAALGVAMNRQAKAIQQNETARSQVKGISDVKKPIREELESCGITVPENTPMSELESALVKTNVTSNSNPVQVMRQLWNNVDDSKLTQKELEFKQNLNAEQNDEVILNNVVAGNRKFYQSSNDLAQKSVYDMEAVYEDIDTSTYDPSKANIFSKAIDYIGRGFINAIEVTDRNPVAKEIISVLKSLEPNSAQIQNEQLIRLGQNYEGSLSNIQALDNLNAQIKAMQDSPELEKKFQTMLDDSNKALYKEKLDENGNPVLVDGKPELVKKSIDEIDFNTPVEVLMKKYGLTQEQAVFGKAIQHQALHDAKLRFESGEYSLATKLADIMADKFNLDRGKALYNTMEILKTYRMTLSKEHGTAGGDYSKLVGIISKTTKDLFELTKFSNEDVTTFTDTFAKALVQGERALFNDFKYNGVFGYTSKVRRGNFLLSYKNEDGTPAFKSFNNKKDLDSAKAELDKKNIKYDVYDTKDKNLPVYDALSIAQAKNLKRNIAQAKHDLLTSLTPEELSKLSPEAQEKFASAIDAIEKNFTAANNVIAKMSLYEKGTTFKRKNIEGATALEMVLNTIDKAKQTARSASYVKDYASISYLSKDPVLVNDTNMARYIQEKIDYMNNADTTEYRPIRSAAVLYYLVGSTSFLFQNLFQVPTLGLARWRNFTGRSSVDFVKSMTEASKLVNDYDHLGTKTNSQDKMLITCMKELENRKVFDQAYSQETLGRKQVQNTIEAIDEPKTLGDKAQQKFDDFIDWSTQLITASESLNRKWITAAYLISENNYKPLAKRSASEIESVLRRASELSDAVNFTGGKATRPYFIQMFGNNKIHGVSLAIMALQNYSLNLAAMLTRQLRQLVPGLDSSKTIASKSYKQLSDRKGLLKTLTILGAITGYYGLPGQEQFDELAVKIFGEKNRPSRALAKSMNNMLEYLGVDEEGENGQETILNRNSIVNAMMYGSPSVFGMDFRNLASNTLTPTALLSDPNVSSILNATGQMFSKLYNFGQAIKDGNLRVASRNMPSALNNVRKITEFVDTGTLTGMRGDPYASAQPGGIGETLATLFGGMPLRVSQGLTQNRQEASVMKELSERKTHVHDLAADVAHNPNALRGVYEKAVKDGVILPDETQFIELVADRLARRDKRYVKEAPLEIRKVMQEIRQLNGDNPVFLSQFSKLKKALELAIIMRSPSAVSQLVDKLYNVDLGKSVMQESGTEGYKYDAMMGNDLNQARLNLIFSN